MKLEPCIILILFLNFSDSEPEYSYKICAYSEVFILYAPHSTHDFII